LISRCRRLLVLFVHRFLADYSFADRSPAS
jgi:hypothetical protein